MTQLSKDSVGGALLDVSMALQRLGERCRPVTKTETVPVRDALGRILAADVTADRDVPPTDNSAVDGYAVCFDDLAGDGETILAVTGRAAAGHPLGRPANRGEAIRILTGAPLPAGIDTVVMQEDCRIFAEGGDDDRVAVPTGLARGDNARARGEDITAGSVILTTGQRLRPQDLGLAASVGQQTLAVHAPLNVALFSTGDEVRDPGDDLPLGGIYDANRACLVALLQGLGCRITDLGIVADDRAAIADRLGAAAADHDLVLTSGGVSVGEEDHVKAAVETMGELAFWRLAIKPGRPVAMGDVAGTPFIGLPGNPAAMMVCFLLIARPAILGLSGATRLIPLTYRVRCGFDHRKKAGRREYVRARLETDASGARVAQKFARSGAGILSSFVEADGLVELPAELVQLEPGDTVEFLPFSEVM